MTSLAEAPSPDQLLLDLPVPVLSIDAQGRIGIANAAAEDFLGASRNRLEGRALADMLEFEDARLTNAFASAEGDLIAQNMMVRLKGGRRRRIDVALATISGHQGWRAALFVEQLTQQDYLPEGARGSIAFGASAVLSHEIKNPLAGIRGAAQLLEKNREADRRPLTSLIISEVDRISKLIDYMQPLGTSPRLSAQRANVHSLIDRALNSLWAAHESLPKIDVNFDPSLPDVLIDPDAMLQILINLLENACEALADSDDPHIVISTRFVLGGAMRSPDSPDKSGLKGRLPVEINIADNGPGVPPKIAANLFSPFVSTKRGGQGLGLALVRKLANDMGGRIIYERDSERELSHFRLFLPVAENS